MRDTKIVNEGVHVPCSTTVTIIVPGSIKAEVETVSLVRVPKTFRF